MSPALRAYMEVRIAEARRILAEPGTGPNMRWLAETAIRQWEAAKA